MQGEKHERKKFSSLNTLESGNTKSKLLNFHILKKFSIFLRKQKLQMKKPKKCLFKKKVCHSSNLKILPRKYKK